MAGCFGDGHIINYRNIDTWTAAIDTDDPEDPFHHRVRPLNRTLISRMSVTV